MKLVPKGHDEYNPVLGLMGVLFVVAGSFGVLILGFSGPLITWLLRGIPAIFVAVGSIILIKQVQLWRRGHTAK
jgi:hypothetical protein